jgi:hypothetical protein
MRLKLAVAASSLALVASLTQCLLYGGSSLFNSAMRRAARGWQGNPLLVSLNLLYEIEG